MSSTRFATLSGQCQLVFSADGKLYYVSSFDHVHGLPKVWLPVHPTDNVAYPFAFYSIKSGERRNVDTSDPLVARYADAEGWPAPDQAEWQLIASKELARAKEVADDHRERLRKADARVGEVEQLIQKFGPQSENN